MLIKATLGEKDELRDFLRKDIEHCLYIYIDFSYYGLEHPHIDFWIGRNSRGDIAAVAMKYHENFQLYSDESYESTDEIAELVKKYMPPLISGEKRTIEKIQGYLKEYDFTEGKVMLLDHTFVDDWDYSEVTEAGIEDTREIAELICSDDYFGKAYSVEEMEEQIRDRIESKMGRHFIVREQGRMIAHNSIVAQVDDICIASLLIVHHDYRRRSNYGFKMEDFIIDKMKSEGKRLYAFLTDEIRIRALKMAGNNIVSEYKRLIKR